MQKNFRRWLSPPDPWENHNTAHKCHHNGTAEWFIRGSVFSEWKFSSTGSLLWIRGKRQYLPHQVTRGLIIVAFVAGAGKTVLWYV
jgi:hypothetical protein